MKDYYELLEVNKNASEDTIKKVFRILIKKNHPDLFEGEEKTKAEEKVKELNEAYEVLSDKDKRKKYNLELEESSSNTDIEIDTLIKENEYLKSVIQEKNRMIREYLEQIGVNTQDITSEFVDEYEEEQDSNMAQNIQSEAYGLYQIKQRLKNIIYMILMILGGIIVLNIVTDINIFKIIINVFKNIF